jgi:hypothetical protein
MGGAGLRGWGEGGGHRAVDARPDAVADVLRERRVREQHVDLREGCGGFTL